MVCAKELIRQYLEENLTALKATEANAWKALATYLSQAKKKKKERMAPAKEDYVKGAASKKALISKAR